MPSAPIQCELSWSASRAREFERCRRENWYARYASWAWWKEEPRGRRYEAMVHKNLTSLAALAGDCMHQAIARWFDLRRAGATMTAGELFEDARDRFRQGWRESSTEAWKRRPNRMVHLAEHHYGEDLGPERTERARETLEASARNFLEMEGLEPVRSSSPGDWLAVEAMDSYRFLGTRVYAVPDFAMRGDGRLHIYDWKTGRPRESDDFQLHTYALFACEKWQADPETITLHAAYLAQGELRSAAVDLERLSETQDRMSESVRAMLELHYDPETDPPRMEEWPTDGAPEACPRCRFRGICEAPQGQR